MTDSDIAYDQLLIVHLVESWLEGGPGQCVRFEYVDPCSGGAPIEYNICSTTTRLSIQLPIEMVGVSMVLVGVADRPSGVILLSRGWCPYPMLSRVQDIARTTIEASDATAIYLPALDELQPAFLFTEAGPTPARTQMVWSLLAQYYVRHRISITESEWQAIGRALRCDPDTLADEVVRSRAHVLAGSIR